MENIPPEFWWLSCALSILAPAGSAVGAWLLYKFWPAIQAGREKERERRQASDNAALDIAKETIGWSRQELSGQQKEFSALRQAIEQLTRAEERRAKLFTLQNGILSEMSIDLKSQQANIVMIADLLKNGTKKRNDPT